MSSCSIHCSSAPAPPVQPEERETGPELRPRAAHPQPPAQLLPSLSLSFPSANPGLWIRWKQYPWLLPNIQPNRSTADVFLRLLLR